MRGIPLTERTGSSSSSASASSTGPLRRKLPPSNIHLHFASSANSNFSDFRHSTSTSSVPHYVNSSPLSAPITSSISSPLSFDDRSNSSSLEPFPVPPWLDAPSSASEVGERGNGDQLHWPNGNPTTFTNSETNFSEKASSAHFPPFLKQKKKYTRKNTRHLSQTEPDWTYLWGYLFLGTTFFIFATSMYATVFSKFMPMTGNKILDYISRDTYYCVLVPLTLPVAVWWAFWNWMGLKTFRTN